MQKFLPGKLYTLDPSFVIRLQSVPSWSIADYTHIIGAGEPFLVLSVVEVPTLKSGWEAMLVACAKGIGWHLYGTGQAKDP